MAKFDYVRSRLTADNLIDKFGQSVTLRRREGSGAPLNFPTIAAVVEFAQNITHFHGELIKAGDRLVYISDGPLGGVTPDPTTDLLVLENGDVMTMVVVKTLQPAGIAVYHEALGRS